MIGALIYAALRCVSRVVCGPEPACSDDLHDGRAWRDSSGVFRCSVCALPLEAER